MLNGISAGGADNMSYPGSLGEHVYSHLIRTCVYVAGGSVDDGGLDDDASGSDQV